MNLMTWNPFTEFDSLLKRRNLLPSQNSGSLDWQPAADISETESEYVIRADLPEVKKEDIELSVHNGVITLSGERRSRTEDQSEKQHRIEKFYGKFTRSFALP